MNVSLIASVIILINRFSTASELILLLELSLKLEKLIKNPEEETSYIMENLKSFQRGFERFCNKVYANDTDAVVDYELMEEEGGPDHIKQLPIDMLPLLEYYDWDSYECWLFGGYLEKAKEMWFKLKDFMKKNALNFT